MKVFIVTDGEYSDYRIVKAFSNMEKAEKYCATRERELECPEILELEIDDVHVETHGVALRKWMVRFFEDGKRFCFANGFSFSPEKKVSVSNLDRRKEYQVIVTTDTKVSEDAAIKVAQDFLAKWKYEQVEKELN